MRSLTERLRTFEQNKARLADVGAKLKLAEKKSQLRRCIRIGELATKAGLADLSEEALYGAMLALAQEGEGKRRQWTVEGSKALAAKAPAADDRGPVVLTFGSYPAAATVVTLRASGFRFNRLMRHWEGLALFEEAEAMAEAYGGVARQLAV